MFRGFYGLIISILVRLGTAGINETAKTEIWHCSVTFQKIIVACKEKETKPHLYTHIIRMYTLRNFCLFVHASRRNF